MSNHKYLFNGTGEDIAKTILSDITKKDYPIKYRDGGYRYGGYYYVEVKQNYNEVEDAILKIRWNDTIKQYEFIVQFYFGALISQARHFYSNVELIKIVNLITRGWQVKGNLNLSYASTKLQWVETPKYKQLDYFQYWKDNNDKIGQRDIAKGLTFLQNLDSQGLLDFNQGEILDYDAKFTKTSRDTVNINPSFRVNYIISQDVAVEVDRKGQLGDFISGKIKECLTTLLPNCPVSFLK
jgi:hypothetical protein